MEIENGQNIINKAENGEDENDAISQIPVEVDEVVIQTTTTPTIATLVPLESQIEVQQEAVEGATIATTITSTIVEPSSSSCNINNNTNPSLDYVKEQEQDLWDFCQHKIGTIRINCTWPDCRENFTTYQARENHIADEHRIFVYPCLVDNCFSGFFSA